MKHLLFGVSMIVDFYNVTDKPNVIEKNLGTRIDRKNIVLLDSFDKFNGTIILSSVPENSNYIHIVSLSRYYFIDKIDIDFNHRFAVHLSEDVLMTYKDKIKNMTVKIIESENVLDSNNVAKRHKKSFSVIDYEFPTQHFQDSKSDVLSCVVG